MNAINIKAAAQAANEIATLCCVTDVGCTYRHGEFDGPGTVEADVVAAELDSLRGTIVRIGWMADRVSALLGGEVCKGSADDWMLSPRFNNLIQGEGKTS